jgi:hypothetical protein
VSDDKRQKVMLGMLAAAGLAFGTYYFVLRDTAPKQQTQVAAPIAKKARAGSDSTEKKVLKGRNEVRDAEDAPMRKVRERADAPRTEKKDRKKNKKQAKKQKLAPAA